MNLLKNLFLVLISIISFSAQSKTIEGFDEKEPFMHKPPAPNTIAGIKKEAKVDDYMLLRGYFTKQVDSLVFEFADDNNDSLFVTFEGANIPKDLRTHHEYFLWGKVLKNSKLTMIQAMFLSPGR